MPKANNEIYTQTIEVRVHRLLFLIVFLLNLVSVVCQDTSLSRGHPMLK